MAKAKKTEDQLRVVVYATFIGRRNYVQSFHYSSDSPRVSVWYATTRAHAHVFENAAEAQQFINDGNFNYPHTIEPVGKKPKKGAAVQVCDATKAK